MNELSVATNAIVLLQFPEDLKIFYYSVLRREQLIPLIFANTGVLTPLGIKENSVCLHAHCMPRRSSLPYDLVRHTLSSLLDPLTVPAGHRDGGDNRSNDSGVGRQNLLAINLRMPECCLPSASTHHRYVGCKQQFTECE
ncbi:Protein of unknown function [Gryllus bimaculatus]|nr:Protein of unknown function [Gryllus bimaculatus]